MRARRAPEPEADLARQREVIDAFLVAAREGDFDRLFATVHRDVVVRADAGARTAAKLRQQAPDDD